MKRGDIAIAALSGDYGKTRPVVIVQNDRLSELRDSVLVCPCTSELHDAPLFRVDVPADQGTGLGRESQIMVDKVMAIPRKRLRDPIGRVSGTALSDVNRALAFVLALND